MRKNLKIALPSSSFLPAMGGAEIGLHNICLNLIKKGHCPVIITSFHHMRMSRKIAIKLPYKIIGLPPKLLSIYEKNNSIGIFFLNIYFLFLQKKYNFDFWHATFGYPLGIAVIQFCKKNSLPHLLRCVGEDIQINKKISYGYRLNGKKDHLIRKIYNQSQCMVAVTESIRKEYLKIGIKDENIRVIPNGVDLNRIRKISKNLNLKRKKSNITFLALGRYHKKKNFEILLVISKKLIKQGYKFNLDIVGTNMESLKSKVLQLKIEDTVKVYEVKNSFDNINEIPSKEIFNFYNRSDCFLMPSMIESFGIVTVEAMCFGLPIIAAKSPGNIDILKNGKFGLIYDGSEKSLIEKMKKIMNDKKILPFYSLKSKERSESFDWNNIVDRYLNLYNILIDSKALMVKKKRSKI